MGLDIDVSQEKEVEEFNRPVELEAVSKIVDHAQGRGAKRFKNGAYMLVFEAFESFCNKALER